MTVEPKPHSLGEVPAARDPGPEALACSLDGGSAEDRQRQWRELAARALVGRRPTDGGARLAFRGDREVEEALRELVGLEAQCCPFLDLQVRREADALVLEVSGPPQAGPVIAEFLGAR